MDDADAGTFAKLQSAGDLRHQRPDVRPRGRLLDVLARTITRIILRLARPITAQQARFNLLAVDVLRRQSQQTRFNRLAIEQLRQSQQMAATQGGGRHGHLASAEPNLTPNVDERRLDRPSAGQDESEAWFLYRHSDAFRGPDDVIRDRLLHYFEVVPELSDPDLATAIDVGCGRGEWLDHLAARGIAATGVEANRFAVAACRDRGHAVVLDDALHYLRQLPDASVDLVTAFHVIEHLELREQLELLHEAHRVLRPGRVLLLETPNPGVLEVGAHTFHLDPTHVRPVPSELLQFMLSDVGFETRPPLFMHPLGDARLTGPDAAKLQHLLFGPADYGVVARRPARSPP